MSDAAVARSPDGEQMVTVRVANDNSQACFSQALLEARGTAVRLELLQTALRKHRKVLAALASLKGLDE
jgi:hypothetical protein